MMIKELIVSFTLVFLLALSVAFAQPGTWAGYVRMDSSIAANGTVIAAVINNGSVAANTTIAGPEYSKAAPAGYYSLSVESSSGNKVNFKVCGIDISIPSQDWSSGPHYNGTTPNFNLSVSKLANSASCTYSCGCSGGYCCSGATQIDGAGSGTCQSSACTAAAAAAPSAGAGGGGGAAVTPTVVEETKTLATIIAGTQADVTITKSSDLKIEKITIEVKNTVNNVQVTVKESSLPSGASLAVSTDIGATYKYLEITKTNIQDADINKVKIRFKVEKTWINNNNIDSTKVALQRYSGGVWNKLTTNKVDEGTTYIYYEAESPGLSVFAVTGEKKVAVAPPACVESWSCTDWSECKEGKQTRTCTDANKCGTTVNKPAEEQVCEVVPPVLPPIVPGIPTWVILIVVVIIGLLVWWKKK